jgi:hypothetical protein
MDRDEILRLARILGVESPERRSSQELLGTIRRRIREAMKVLEKSGADGRSAGGGGRSALPPRTQPADRQRA